MVSMCFTFLLLGSLIGKHPTASLVSHYADPSLPEHRVHMETEMAKVAEYMALGNNFYSPHYRHITLDSWATLNEDTIARRYMDVSSKM